MVTYKWSALFVLVAAQTLHGQRVVYVDHSAAGKNDGTNWHNAYTYLQDALQDAEQNGGCPCEIWVAAGTYRPDSTGGDRYRSFNLLNEVAIYGGFEGWEERLEQRNPAVHETVLSGDNAGNDADGMPATSNCCSANGEPGCDNDACEQLVDEFLGPFSHCVAEHWNYICARAAQFMCCDLCRPTRCDNAYTVVRAHEVGSSAVLDGFTITHGEAYCLTELACGAAGGLFSEYGDATFGNLTFTGNVGMEANAAFIWPQSESTFKKCTFRESRSEWSSFYALRINGGAVDLGECSFVENDIGASYIGDGVIEQCQFIRNRRRGLTVGQSPVISDSLFMENMGGGLEVGVGQPWILNSRFIGNHTPGTGGGIVSSSAIVLINSVFAANCALSDEDSAFAGAIAAEGSYLINCTVYGNAANSVGGVWLGNGGSIVNSILFENSDLFWGEGEQAQLGFLNEVALPDLRYNSIQGWSGAFGGIGNVGLDPVFVDADGEDDVSGTLDDNLRLSPDSPMIDAGDPDPPLAPYLDLDGHARILCGSIDMGAYEFGIGDYNCDRAVELSDFMAFPACMSGPNGGPYANWCESFDFHAEIADRIDLLDFAGLQASIGVDWP